MVDTHMRETQAESRRSHQEIVQKLWIFDTKSLQSFTNPDTTLSITKIAGISPICFPDTQVVCHLVILT